ncbi:DNA gyrase subunit A [archaeon]|nr:DNA gyrase subunit A [archaeon]
MAEEIQKKLIEEELKESYIDYAMSVITQRALPDVYDGLKPVHRRILFAMKDLGLDSNKSHKKSARIVGEILGKYHPHGDSSVYDALVRLAQNFSLRYPLIQGQGNFGSIDGLPQAAMRYTEARLTKISEELLQDLDKETVKFIPNFDGSLKEPVVLPGKFPNLLANGTSGIAVGMASNIPPHNLNEVLEAINAYIENNEITNLELMKFIQGPDFPTGGIIVGKQGIIEAYKSGRGKIKVRAKTETKDGKIIITEIPYMVNKTSLLEGIADLVKDKRIDGIRDLRDESDRKGLRVVIFLKKDANADVVLNQLYKHSQMQVTFGAMLIALHEGQPKVMTLKDLVKYYVKHRINIVRLRTEYDLRKAKARKHIVEGLIIALNNIDAIVKGIKESENIEKAREFLMNSFNLSVEQANAILDMKLSKLSRLEQNKLNQELNELIKLIKKLEEILGSEEIILQIIKDELNELREKYGDERRTEIIEGEDYIEHEDLIEKEDLVVTFTKDGYIKSTELSEYKSQRRGGQGVTGAKTKEEDIIENLFVTSSLNYLLCFTNKGKVHWLKAYQIPKTNRYSKGKAIVNLLPLDKGEEVSEILSVDNFENYLMFVTKKGIVKRIKLNIFNKPRKGGVKAIKLKNDEVVRVILVKEDSNLIIATKNGMAVKFKAKDIREMGRNAAGVRGIRLKEDEVVGMEIGENNLLVITEKGYGKKTDINEYRLIKRGGKGVTNIKITDKNGKVVGIKTIGDNDEILIVTKKGIIIRINSSNISKIGRSTQGVRLIRLKENDKVKSLGKVVINGA